MAVNKYSEVRVAKKPVHVGFPTLRRLWRWRPLKSQDTATLAAAPGCHVALSPLLALTVNT